MAHFAELFIIWEPCFYQATDFDHFYSCGVKPDFYCRTRADLSLYQAKFSLIKNVAMPLTDAD